MTSDHCNWLRTLHMLFFRYTDNETVRSILNYFQSHSRSSATSSFVGSPRLSIRDSKVGHTYNFQTKSLKWPWRSIRISNKNCKANGSAVCFLYNIFSVILYCFNQSFTVSFSKKWVAMKRTGCWMVWKNGPADNVTGAVRNDHRLPEHKLWVVFATRLPELTPCLKQSLSQLDHVADWSLVHSLLHHASDVVVHRVQSVLLAGRMSGLMNSGVSLNQFYQVIIWIVRKRLWLMWSKSDFLHFTR